MRDGYLELARAEPARYRVLDAALPPDQVEQAVWSAVAPLLEARA